jgi:hypothetical protein
MRRVLGVIALLSALVAPLVASAQTTKPAKGVVTCATVFIEARAPKPILYILERNPKTYQEKPLEQSFVPKILKSVERF